MQVHVSNENGIAIAMVIVCLLFVSNLSAVGCSTDIHVVSIVNSLLSGSFLIKFPSLSAPTKIEELTEPDQTKNTAQPRRESNPGSCEF